MNSKQIAENFRKKYVVKEERLTEGNTLEDPMMMVKDEFNKQAEKTATKLSKLLTSKYKGKHISFENDSYKEVEGVVKSVSVSPPQQDYDAIIHPVEFTFTDNKSHLLIPWGDIKFIK